MLKRAVKESPLAEELYEVAVVLNSMFGVSEGKSIFRAAAAEGEGSLHVPAGTRKYASLSKEPGNITENLRAYARALGARTTWRRQGHGNYTIAALGDFGRRLVAADFVAFAILFRDIAERTIRPTALVCQELAEAWIIHRKMAFQMERMRDAEAALRGLREFLRVLVLLMQWVSSATCVNLLEAAHYASPGDRMIFGKYEDWGPRRHTVWGRVCPRFMHAMAGFISRETPMYRGTPLQRTRGRGPAGVQVPAAPRGPLEAPRWPHAPEAP